MSDLDKLAEELMARFGSESDDPDIREKEAIAFGYRAALEGPKVKGLVEAINNDLDSMSNITHLVANQAKPIGPEFINMAEGAIARWNEALATYRASFGGSDE